MCGIAGFVNLDGAPPDAAVLEAMTDMVRHRGPDDRSTLCLSIRGGAPDTALGFHRLAILDRSTRARQPMISPDGSVALLFNGEVYDAFDARAELERAIGVLLETPTLDEKAMLVPKGVTYSYSDPALQSIPAAQKQLLRLGPRNGQIVRGKLEEIAALLELHPR